MSVITILGAGAMGSALATPLTQAGWETRLWGTWLDDHLIGPRLDAADVVREPVSFEIHQRDRCPERGHPG